MIKLTLDSALEKYGLTRYELAKRTDIQCQIIDNYYKNKVKDTIVMFLKEFVTQWAVKFQI